MENKKFQNLIALIKKIEPSADFLHQSKMTIAVTLQEEKAKQKSIRFIPMRMVEGITLRSTFAFASIFLVAIVASTAYFTTTSNHLAKSLDDKALAQEATSLDFEIQIAEAAYFDQSARQVALALDKISEDNAE